MGGSPEEVEVELFVSLSSICGRGDLLIFLADSIGLVGCSSGGRADESP